MNRTVLKWAGVVAMGIAATGQAGGALACMPFGGGETGARGGSDKVGQLMSDGANVAYYEWSEAHQAFMLMARWFDPSAAQAPQDPEEVDVTDAFFGSTMFCSGGGPGWQPHTLPVVTAWIGPDGVAPSAFGLTVRATNLGNMGNRGLARVNVRRATVTNNTTCDAGWEAADAAACQAIRTVSPIVRSGEIWRVTFADNRSATYVVTSPQLTYCAVRAADSNCE